MDARDIGNDVLVVLPTYNEVATLESVIEGLRAAVPGVSVLVVDDASPDGTGLLADQLASQHSHVHVLHRPAKQGLGTAYIAGFRWALGREYRWVVQMDSDGSHLPEQLPALLAAAGGGGAARGADLVIGARWIPGGSVEGWPWHRRWVSRTGTRVARIALRSRLHDITSGFRVLSRDGLAQLRLDEIDSQGYAFQVETAWSVERSGLAIAEVPITFVERRAGRSKMTMGIVFEALALVVRWGLRLRLGRG